MLKKLIIITFLGVLGSFWYIWSLGGTEVNSGIITIPVGASFTSVIRLV